MIPDTSCIVYTPERLADALVASIMPRRRTPDQRWLEPCVGEGALLLALSKRRVDCQQITGIDLAHESAPTDALARVKRGVDFLGWSQRTTLRFDRIVANPPYLAIRELSGALLDNALATVVPTDGSCVPHRANCWYAFLCASIGLLRDNGSLAFVLPAAWDYADYADALRAGIGRLFRAVKCYRSVYPLFSGVQEGAVVLVAEGYGSHDRHPVARMTYRRAHSMFAAIGQGSVTRAARAAAAPQPSRVPRLETRRLSDVITLRIGAVTGDGKYFLLNEARRKSLRLPVEAMVPVLSRASHLVKAEVTQRDWQRLREAGDRVWLFRPSQRLLAHAAVKRYLELPWDEGGCDRTALHVLRREPQWYQVKLPRRPDGFVTGMGQFGPWIVINRSPTLSATNTLYALRFNHEQSLAQMAAWGLMLLCDETQGELQSALRKYPDGLLKIEPGDFGRIILPVPRKTLGALGSYRDAVGYLVAGDKRKAAAIANRYI